jgi:hypothetical protein
MNGGGGPRCGPSCSWELRNSWRQAHHSSVGSFMCPANVSRSEPAGYFVLLVLMPWVTDPVLSSVLLPAGICIMSVAPAGRGCTDSRSAVSQC